MTRLYICDVSGLDVPSALGQVSEYRRQKALRLNSDEARRQSLGVELLLYRALGKVDYSVNEYGKPCIENGAHFSLSHCKHLAVCAVSDAVCGVDIEVPRKDSIKLAKRFFTENEYSRIAESDDPDGLFCRYWVIKESYLKAIGTGMNTPLNSFEAGDKIGSFYTKVLEYKGFCLALCSLEPLDDIEITEEII